MEQLALSKIQAFAQSTDASKQFRLVKAFAELGEAYFGYKCYEQAIQHLTMALKKNSTLFELYVTSQGYHSEILTSLGKCYFEAGSNEDALELLGQAR